MGASMDAICVLFGYLAGANFVALVASEFPDVVEVAPELLYELLGPHGAGVFGWAVAVAVVLFLVLDDGCGDLASEEVLPANGLLVDGCSE